ncbi:MAG: ATP-binding cassette domain-containing protein [Pseudobdellovibrio sp.]
MEYSSFDLNHIHLEGVTLAQNNLDAQIQPILAQVDFVLPMDQTVVIESSNPMHSLQFIQMLAGYKTCSQGKILWNSQDVFSDTHEVDPRDIMGVYFEGHFPVSDMTIKDVLKTFLSNDKFKIVCEMFELNAYLSNQISKANYSMRKLVTLIQVVSKQPQLLILEDPATGLSETQWLNLLDYIQLHQRKGYLRHIFMTNHHSTALNHLEHNKLFVEDGLIYFDETVPVKKVAHF